MSLTVKELKRFLQNCPDDMEIMTEQGEQFIHTVNMNDNTLVLSKHKPIGFCNRTGCYVYPTESNSEHDYKAYSPALDEDLFEFEFHRFTEDELKEKAKECL